MEKSKHGSQPIMNQQTGKLSMDLIPHPVRTENPIPFGYVKLNNIINQIDDNLRLSHNEPKTEFMKGWISALAHVRTNILKEKSSLITVLDKPIN